MTDGHGHAVIRGDVSLGRGVGLGEGCVLDGRDGPISIGHGSVLGDHVVVHAGVRLGDGARIGSFVELGHPTKSEIQGFDPSELSERVRDLVISERETRIGAGALIRSHSIVYSHVDIGERLTTGHGAIIREHTTIGPRCIFGTYASCDGYTRIGDDVQVGQYAQLSQSARIGDGCFIGGHTVFSDNRMAIRSVDEDLFGAVIEDYVRVGLACVILPAVRIGTDALVGAGSVVTKDVEQGSLAAGNPARVLRALAREEIDAYRRSVRPQEGTAS
jgi:acetyltransferase-like isoleucine patch superfamily enzyme